MKTSCSMLIGLAVTLASVCQVANTEIIHRLQPGQEVIPSYTQAYRPDQRQRYLVSDRHRLPAGMVVQGDTVVLTIDKDVLDGLDQSEVTTIWSLSKACGESELIADASNPLKARFRAGGYGINGIAVDITDGKTKRQLKTEVYCEFSTGTTIEVLKQDIRLPKGYKSNPHVEKPEAAFVGHREWMLCRNPKTGRLVMVWWAKLDHPKSGPLGARWTALVAMISDDHGLTWRDAQIVYHQSMNRTGWGSIVWNPGGNEGQGEFLLWTATNVHEGNAKPNGMLLFRSRDNAESWDLAANHTETIRKELGRPSLRSTYFGGNRMVVTSRDTIVAAMVCNQHARAIWSGDNGASWHNSTIDDTFPKGNEDALIETVDGKRLILFARPSGGEGRRRFESTDGGKTWEARPDSTVPATRVNFGLGRVDAPGSKWHGRIMHTASTFRNGRHDRYRLVISINSDVQGVSEKHWDSRTLLNYAASYSDVQYLPEDKSIYVIVETWPFGEEYTGKWVWGDTPMCRYFKFSPRYFEHLPEYDPDEPMPKSAIVSKASSHSPQ